MIKLHINITWPVAVVLLFALIAYLTRDPGRRPTRRSAKSSLRPTPRRSREEPFVIDQDGSFDAETDRLDREAAEAGRRAYDETSAPFEAIKTRINERNEKRNRHARR